MVSSMEPPLVSVTEQRLVFPLASVDAVGFLAHKCRTFGMCDHTNAFEHSELTKVNEREAALFGSCVCGACWVCRAHRRPVCRTAPCAGKRGSTDYWMRVNVHDRNVNEYWLLGEWTGMDRKAGSTHDFAELRHRARLQREAWRVWL